jgi:hypothetical protein
MPYTDAQRELEENILHHGQCEGYHKTMRRRFRAIRDAKPPETLESVLAACEGMPTMEEAVEATAKTEAAIDEQAARDEQDRKDRAAKLEAEDAE